MNEGLIGAAAGAGQGLLSNWQARSNAARTNKYNRGLAKLQHKQNVEMWNMMNMYNTPAAQMQRFKDAGLNPHLIYGQGTPGNTTMPPAMPGYKADFSNIPAPIDTLQMLNAYQDYRMKKAQTNLIEANEEKVMADVGIKDILGRVYGVKLSEDTRRHHFNIAAESDLLKKLGLGNQRLEYDRDSAKYKSELSRTQLLFQEKILEQQLRQATTESERKDLEYKLLKLREDYEQMGIRETDNVLLRLLLRQLNKSGYISDEGDFNFF